MREKRQSGHKCIKISSLHRIPCYHNRLSHWQRRCSHYLTCSSPMHVGNPRQRMRTTSMTSNGVGIASVKEEWGFVGGMCAAMQTLENVVAEIAPTNIPVLLVGE